MSSSTQSEKCMLELFKLFVRYTPTEKDDKVLADVEQFLNSNPALKDAVLSLVFKVLRTRIDKGNDHGI